MEEKKSTFNKIYEKVQQSFFDIMLDLLKGKTTGILDIFIMMLGKITACVLMSVMFLQIISILFEEIVSFSLN